MSDPMTQSSQISSSRGLNDGHSATSKDSKFSDSFISSPVSLIQSPQEIKVVLGSDKSAENLATSLHFSPPQSFFSPVGPPEGNIGHTFKEKKEHLECFGSQNQDSSPIKTSPVSERIKALEALAAKQKDTDRNNGGFPHFKERHYEKSDTVSHGISSRLSFQKKTSSTEQDSPESPFEVLGEVKCGNDFEDTADWMKAHLPPAPDFNAGNSDLEEGKDSPLVLESPCKVLKPSKVETPQDPETFAVVPDQFMDRPTNVAEINDGEKKQPEEGSVEEESEFDLSFLPTAYMWDRQEKPNVETQYYQIFLENEGLNASPAPPVEFESPSPPATQQTETSSMQHISTSKGNLEPAEFLEVDSSGESDDTVIEEAGSVPAKGNNSLETELHTKVTKMPNQEKTIQVPIINVIETEEQVLSDDDEEEQQELEITEEDLNYKSMQGEDQESTTQHSDVPEHISVETDPKISTKTDSDEEYPSKHMMIEDDHEKISCITDSDAEYSSKHMMIEDDHEKISTKTDSDAEYSSKQMMIEDDHEKNYSMTDSDAEYSSKQMMIEGDHEKISTKTDSDAGYPSKHMMVEDDHEKNYGMTDSDAEYSSKHMMIEDDHEKISTKTDSEAEYSSKHMTIGDDHEKISSMTDSSAEFSSKHMMIEYDHEKMSSMTVSDAEYSSKRMKNKDDLETGICIQSSDSGGLNLGDFEVQLPKSQNSVSNECPMMSFFDKEPEKHAEICSDNPLNNSYPLNEPSEVETYLDHHASEELALKDQLNLVYLESKTEETAQSSCLADSQNISTLVQESFEENITEDYDETPSKHNLDCDVVPVPSLSDPSSNISDSFENVVTLSKLPVDVQEQMSAVKISETLLLQEELPIQSDDQQLPVQENTPTLFPSFHNELSGQIDEVISCPLTSDVVINATITNSKPEVVTPKDVLDGSDSPETMSDTENVEPECSATDSFVEFMRECLKSKEDVESKSHSPGYVTIDQNAKSDVPTTSPEMIMDFEQESITISALKKLGSSQEQGDENPSTVNTDMKPSKAVLPMHSNPEHSITSSSSLETLPNEYASESLLPKEVEAIDILVAEAYHLAEHVLTVILTHLTVCDLVHWRDPKKSGVVFGVSLLLLLSLAAFSVISVVSYLLLALLCVTISFRIYKSVIQAVQKSNEGHPFKALMEKDVTLPPETFRKHVDQCLSHINCVLKKMSRLFLVEDLVDSLKLAVVMWVLTYVGAVFNGITLLILADILLFTVPPIYEKNKTQIDHYIDIVRTQVNNTIAKLQEKLPGALKRQKTE
nr:reticulon-3 isoform X1 [Misgurnus anguillicaudatus]